MIPTSLDLTLQPGITLSGSIKDVKGAPLTNATVDFRIESSRSSRQMSPPLTKVDAKGSFIIPALPQGRTYYFFNDITAKGFGSTGGLVDAKNTRTNHYEFPDFVLKRTDRMLAGRVLDPDGNPVAGARVRFSGQGQPQNVTAKTDNLGNFVFDAVCEGGVQLSASADVGGAPGVGIFMSSGSPGIKVQAGDTNIVINLRDTSGNRKPLHEAARNGNKSAVQSLLANKADVNAKDNYGVTPLLEAVKRGDLAVVALLLTNKADVNASDRYGVTPLHKAAVGSNNDMAESVRVGMAELLLANNADVNARANNGFTPLHWAAMYNHPDLVRWLLAYGAEVNAMSNNGDTPLHWAVYAHQATVAEILRQNGGLEHGYEAGKPAGAITNWDAAAMRDAANSDDVKEIKSLLQANPNLIFCRDNQARTPLILAAFHGKRAAVELLLASKGDINDRDIFGRTPLHWAAQNGYPDVVEILLASQADANVRETNGNTPLHFAASLGRKAVVEVLLAHNAEVNATNYAGGTPLHSVTSRQESIVPAGTGARATTLPPAIMQGQKDVAELLRQHGGRE